MYLLNTDKTTFELDEAQSSGWWTYYLPVDEDDLTLVYEEDEYVIEQFGTGTDDRHPVLNVTFNQPEPFVYTGENLLVCVKFEQPKDTRSCFFSFDNSMNPNGDKFIRFRTDSDLDDLDLVQNWSMVTYGTPVIVLLVSKDVALVEGTVTDEASELPIEGAQVTFVSGDVIYNATTDDKGEYSVTVYQSDLIYEATVEADAYESATESAVTFIAGEEANTKDYALTPHTEVLDFTADPANNSEVESLSQITLTFAEGVTLALDSEAKATVSVGDVEEEAALALDASGLKLTITLAEELKTDKDSAGTVTIPQYALFVASDDISFFSDEITLNYTIKATSGVNSIIYDGESYEVYNLSGVRVAKSSVENLNSGVYVIKKADGTTSKVIIK